MSYFSRLLLLFFLLCSNLLLLAQSTNVPILKGSVKGPFVLESDVFPGTTRDYWVYVPAQYDDTKAACVMILQDGMGLAKTWNVPKILDTLISRQEVPVTIGIFVSWGKVAAANANSYPRTNRSFEYDALGNRYAQFLLHDLLPQVAQSYNLSTNPNDRLLGGASSGAICALNAAWEHPEEFRRVLSSIGTYVGLRGGEELSTLIRKTEPRPIRIFLQGDKKDLNIYPGNWKIANEAMLSALEWAGYDVKSAWGNAGHSNSSARPFVADALRWLWRDYPKEIKAGAPQKRITDILIPEEDWEIVDTQTPFQNIESMATNKAGEIACLDWITGEISLMDATGKVRLLNKTAGLKRLQYGPDGYWYALKKSNQKIVRLNEEGIFEELSPKMGSITDFLVTQYGIYTINAQANEISFHHQKFGFQRRYTIEDIPSCLSLTAEQTFLQYASLEGKFGYSFLIDSIGALQHHQAFTHYHIPYDKSGAQAYGMAVDHQNRLYTLTDVGIQVSDQLGRIQLIIDAPVAGAFIDHLTFGGPNFDELYISIKSKIYKRKLKTKGVFAWQKPTKPGKPNL